MNNNNGNFSNGFMLGLILGGGAVFLLTTKTGRRILKIISEKGVSGILEVLNDYDLADFGEELTSDLDEDINSDSLYQDKKDSNGKTEERNTIPKKRFFKKSLS